MALKSNKLLLEAMEHGHRYTAKQLHDGVAQTALQLGLQAGICQKLLDRNRLEMLAAELAQLETQIQKVAGQVRELIQDLRPPAVDGQADLRDYVQYVIDIYQNRSGVSVEFQLQVSPAQPELNRLDILGITRIVQAGLQTLCQASPGQKISVSISGEQNALEIVMINRGVTVAASAPPKEDVSLTNLRLKVLAMGGEVTLEKAAEGCPTTIRALLPL